MDSNLTDFVMKAIEEINPFDRESIECMKKVIRKAIDFYHLKTYEEVEETHVGSVRFLHVHSIMEENMLSKIVVVIRNGETDLDIEGVYEGHVVREY
ncbi:DUF6407 family protein [Bacillus spizizenii]|uniref:DUF6407 family protein n=3 Tax=Bacillus spizizenii TaxID=96241 RepID=A0A9Q4HAQ1_BACSC|nr:DUF6407 family protein [Bacillus spizizenii]KFI03259.1 hypothetical protein JN25_10190 [Bacillus sp. BSC154]MDU7576851.1 DUF6407 family protein [Bacillus subtilis]ADB43062.1 hypothetical protein [Bacillus spizizenii ATCC 6633 = JCM 2499]ADM36245.1 hypothetical protein BSUW23_00940 [Bacillus spizizenii str. W23]AJW85717.1 hypothetical protein BIS30_11460 [Bacillus spizizenii]